MGLDLTAGGIGLVLAAITAVAIWKAHRKGKRGHGWLALLAGLFSSGTVVGIMSVFVPPSTMVAGAGIFTVILAVGGFIFWHETVKGNDPHHIRTPVVGFLVGVALSAVFGGVHSAVGSTTTQVTSYVHQIGK